MNNVTNIHKEKKTDKIKFSTSSKIVRSAFIIGIINILLIGIFLLIIYFIQPDPLIIYLLMAIFFTISLSAMIANCLAFKKGKNIFNILGFIFNLITMILSVAFIVTLSLANPFE